MEHWHSAIGEPAIADAILNWLVHQWGAFAAATGIIAYALLLFTPRLIGFSLHCFCNRIYFTMQEARNWPW